MPCEPDRPPSDLDSPNENFDGLRQAAGSAVMTYAECAKPGIHVATPAT